MTDDIQHAAEVAQARPPNGIFLPSLGWTSDPERVEHNYLRLTSVHLRLQAFFKDTQDED